VAVREPALREPQRTPLVRRAPIEEPWTTGPGLAASLWRFRVLVVVCLVLGVAGGYLGAEQQATVYEARGELVLEGVGPARLTDDTAFQGNPERRLRNQVEQLDSWRIREEASALLDGDVSPGRIDDALTVSGTPEADVITLSARAGSPELAADIVNAVGAAYLDLAGDEAAARAAAQRTELELAIARLEERIAELTADLDVLAEEGAEDETLDTLRRAALRDLIDLSSRAQRLALTEELRPTGVRSFQEALPPRQPVQPRPRVAGALGGLLGLVLAGAFAWWRAGRGDRVRTPAAAARLLGVPVLGSIPVFGGSHLRRLLPWRPPRPSVEPYRFLALAIDEALAGDERAAIAVTSAVAGEGKTIVAVNTALSARGSDRYITLVDTDPTGRGLTAMYSLEGQPGLRELARDEAGVTEVRRLIETSGGTRVAVVPVGRHEVAVHLSGGPLQRALAEVRASSNLVVADTGSVLSLSEAVAVIGQADAVLIVVRHGTRSADLERLRERLTFGSTRILGLVYNADPDPRLRGTSLRSVGRGVVTRPRGM
jgi:uncharacterized protein involved in exopolysaccharide biosynthesis